MSCESCVTNRDTQNRDTPNLPFAQELITYQGTTNPDRPDLPFAQSSNRSRGVYIVYWKDGQQSEMTLTNSVADYYRNLGHRVVLKNTVNPVLPSSTNGLTSDQVLQIVKSEYGDDIALLHRNVSGIGTSMTQAKEHRDRIESKIGEISSSTGLNKQQVTNIVRSEYGDDIDLLHSNVSGLGSSLSETKAHRDSIESKIDSAKAEHQDIHEKLTTLGQHSHIDITNPFDPTKYLPYILIAGVAIYAVSSRRKRS